MDPRTVFLAGGQLMNGRLHVTHRSGSRTLGKRPSLLVRWREHKDLKRRCQTGLKERDEL